MIGKTKHAGWARPRLGENGSEHALQGRHVGQVCRGQSAWPHRGVLSTGAAGPRVVSGVQLQQRVELQGEAVAHGRWQAERRQLGSEAAHGSPPCRAALRRATSRPLEPQTARAVVADERSKSPDVITLYSLLAKKSIAYIG